MNKNSLGIDISGRSIKMKAYDAKGGICTKHYAISNFSKESLFKAVCELSTQCNTTFEVIGIAQSGNVLNGTLISSNRHPLLNGLNGNWFVENGLCLTAKLMNDAEAVAAYGHKVTGSDNISALIIGTGLGCGLWKNGDIVFGANGLSDINNIPFQDTVLGKRCASIAIHTDEEKNWTLNNLSNLTVVSKIEAAAKHFGYAIRIADRYLSPDVIFVSGGVSRFPNYFEIAVETANANAKVVLCKDIDFAGCDGALYYAQI